MNVVLDTNVFISGLFWNGIPHELLILAERGKFVPVATSETLSELFGVLNRKAFDELFKQAQTGRHEMFKHISSLVTLYPPAKGISPISADPDDTIFLSCAVSANVSHIVSGDQHLLRLKKFGNILIVTPKKFLDEL